MPRLIAVDVGSHAVKVATYRINGREVTLEERHHQPVPQGGTAPMFEQRLAALDALLDDVPEVKPTGTDIVLLAFPSSLATFRPLTLPFTDANQIENTLPYEVENEVPFDLDDMVLGWRIAEQDHQSSIVAVLAKKDDVGDWIEALQERGLDPASVHVDADLYGPWGRLRTPTRPNLDEELDEDSGPPRPSLVAVLDLGHLHTTISVVKNGTVRSCRSISTGGWAFTQAIAQATGLSWEEAEALKHGGTVAPGAIPSPNFPAPELPPRDLSPPVASVSDDDWDEAATETHAAPVFDSSETIPALPDPADDFGPTLDTEESGLTFGLGAPSLPPPTQSGFSNLPPRAREKLQERFDQLIGELRSTLIQVEDQLEGDIEEIRLTGGSARIEELRERLATELGVNVRLAEDPTGENAFGPFSLSAALASTTVPGANKAIDLRLGEFKYRGGTNVVRAALTYGIAGAFFFSVAATVMFAWEYVSLSSDLGAAEDAVHAIVADAAGPDAGAVPELDMSQSRLFMVGATEDAAALAKVVGDGKSVPPTVDMLYHLTKSFPPHPEVTVELSNLTINQATVQFKAETSSFEQSAQVEEALQRNSRFANASKGKEDKGGSKIKFPITIPLGDAEAESTDAEEG